MLSRRVPALLGAGLALCLGAGLAPGLADAAAEPVFTPGAAGAGDSYFPRAGNGGYDARHYRLRVRYRPSSNRLVGLAVMTATATQDLSRFDLDLDGLSVRSVTVDGAPAGWRRSGGELVVTPAGGITAGATFVSSVSYDGIPKTLSDGSGFFHTDDGMMVVGQPRVAATWFPVNDHPTDKASYTFHITAPRRLQVVANGRLADRWRRGPWTTWEWRAGAPMAPYLATANIGEFRFDGRYHRGIRIVDALDPDLDAGRRSQGAVARRSFARQGEMLDFLAGRFGDYPFDTAGGIVDDLRGLGFALENQTRPIYSRVFFSDRRSGDAVVVHELAHQWFGDDVAVSSWRDIWLNEGFATYAEWLWSEREGQGTAQQIFDAAYAAIPADDGFWELRIGDPGPDHLFDEAVYLRGAMAVHQLRREIGDEAFAVLLRRWTAKYAGATAGIAQLVALAEEVSGRELDDFFDAWLYTAAKPAVSIARPDVPPPPAARRLLRRLGHSG